MQLQCLCEVEARTDISFLRTMYHFSYILTYLLTKLQTERSAATETWQTKAGKPWGSSVWIGETNHHISPMQQQQQQFLMACLIINNCCTSEQQSATRRRFAFDDDTRRPATRCIKNTRCSTLPLSRCIIQSRDAICRLLSTQASTQRSYTVWVKKVAPQHFLRYFHCEPA